MTGRLSSSALVALRRRVYLLLLMAGLAGVYGWMIRDVRATVAGETALVAAAPGTGMKALTEGTVMDGFGAWSPDGKQIAFMRSGRVWLIGAEGKGARALTSQSDGWDAVSAWRPDGKALAVVRLAMNGELAQIMLIDPASKQQRLLVEERGPIGYLAWGPGGAHLYYTTPTRILRLDLAASRAQVVVTLPEGWEMIAGGITVSKDGGMAVYGAGPRMGRVAQYDLWTVSLRTPGAQPVRLTTGGGIMPSLDESGKRLVYRSPRQTTGIYLMDLSTHRNQLIVADEPRAMHFHPAFAPNGRSIVLSRLIVDPDSDRQDRLTSHLHLHTLGASGGD